MQSAICGNEHGFCSFTKKYKPMRILFHKSRIQKSRISGNVGLECWNIIRASFLSHSSQEVLTIFKHITSLISDHEADRQKSLWFHSLLFQECPGGLHIIDNGSINWVFNLVGLDTCNKCISNMYHLFDIILYSTERTSGLLGFQHL